MRAGLRLLAFLLLGAAWLSGCTLLHPRRISNPNLPPGYKAQQKAARKAQKAAVKAADDEAKARRKHKDKDKDKDKDEEPADAPADAASGVAPTEAAPASSQANSAQPDRPTVKYDKNGLMKKPKLKRRHYYKPAPKPFRPWHSITTFFQNLTKRHPHGTPKSGPEPSDQPAPSDRPAKPGKPAAPPAPVPTPAPAGTGLTP